ncbi:FAD binding domain-containing protein [Ephemerocybe angulata]|uniref:FAD binding domain-containing protein n=1 Tax=Ephemerocybe angulata TaxID=980116 RepID=A0A8H6I8G9_9AGAR|nr:FAD binding domain-containing protein [Tulosesus angulatus]
MKYLSLLAVIFVPLTSVSGGPCRCIYGQDCWPSEQAFSSLASRLSQPLLRPTPAALPCYGASPEACASVKTNFTDAQWRSNLPGVMQMTNLDTYIFPNNTISACPLAPVTGETCGQGSVPPVGVDARTPQDVQEAVRFAKRYNLRVVVHNTGHDFLGRSTGRGGFLVWTHWMKDIAFQESFVAETDRVGKGVQAITLGAGVQWVEAYKAIHAKGRIVVGGVSIGGTVGAAGGWILGGGHSALSPAYGFGVDNVLEFKLVTADAKYLTVNAHNNPSLFWALRGGGGGTFGIVTSVTYRTHPNVPLIASFATTNFSTPEIAQKVATEFIRVHPALSDYHWGGYSLFSNHSFQMFQIVPNVSQAEAQKTVQPFFDFLTDTAGNATLSGLMEFPTFLDWINFIFGLTPGSQVGFGQEVSSRLLAKDTALRKPEETAKLLLSLPRGVSLNSVAGGASSLIDPSSSAFHPSWRRAIAEITISESWGDSDSTVENIRAAQARLQATTRVLDTVTTDSAAYYNEATLHEDDFRKSFLGPHYRRLKEIKHQVDPDSLFVVPRGVGSEDWDDQLNCRK